MKGSLLVKDLEKLTPQLRESAILIAFANEWYPNWLGLGYWQPVTISATVKDKKYNLVIYVSPDYFALGDDTDYVRMPATPQTFQLIANKFGAILPSTRIVDYIFSSAKYKLEPKPIPPPPKYIDIIENNSAIEKQLKEIDGSPTTGIVIGDKKDVVIGPNLNGDKVAIYGWYKKDGSKWQPYSTIHISSYSDYSHGGRFILRKCALNGDVVNIEDLFQDKDLNVLVSDQGAFKPYFPNTDVSKAIDFENPPLPDAYRDLPVEETEKPDNRGVIGAAVIGLSSFLLLRSK